MTAMTERQRIDTRVREIRESKGLSQSELAELSGLRQQHLSRIESGKYSTGIDILSAVASALGHRLDFV